MGFASSQKVASFIYSCLCLALYAYGVISASYIPSHIEGIILPLDFMVGIPLGFFFLVIRTRGITALYVIPVIWIGYALSVLALGSPSAGILPYLLAALVPVEVAVAIKELRKLVKVYRSAHEQSADPMSWFKAAMLYLIPKDTPASIAAAELSVWYYALFSWRKKPYVREGETAFTYHNASGYMNMMLGLALAFPVEIIGVHLLMAQWSLVVACVITVLSIYAAIWLVGDARARIMRPVTVSDDVIRLECGIQMCATVSRSDIEMLCYSENELVDMSKNERLNCGTFYQANIWIVFKSPIVVSTILGEKSIRALGLSLDDPHAFIRAMKIDF